MEAEELVKRYQSGERDFILLSLRRSDFCGADLNQANLSGSDLREANLSKANLAGAHLAGVRPHSVRATPGPERYPVVGYHSYSLALATANRRIASRQSVHQYLVPTARRMYPLTGQQSA